MLRAHLDAVERHLLQISQIPANAGHTLHRGTPREAFIKEFLTKHLSAKLAVGTGEIIDASSLPREPRNQFDIVIYKADYPRIDLGGGINAFLAESVVATIEVKSLLTKSELETAVLNAARVKKLSRNLITSMTSGYVPPGILSYVVAYDGPAQISTVMAWVNAIEAEHGLNTERLPATRAERASVMSESLEGVFLLGRGAVIFDNAPISLISDDALLANPAIKYSMISGADGNLLWLFLLLTMAGSNLVGQWPNLIPYLQRSVWQLQTDPPSG
jgi:hypothetical protein